MNLAIPVSFITDAGDSGLLLPMALVGVGVLWFFHSRRLAVLLLQSVVLAGVFIAVLKVLFLSCGMRWIPSIQSPSGHACLSAVVYGTLGTIFAAGRPPIARALIHGLAAFFVIVIAVSRLTLGVHTLPEVILGLLVGGFAQAWFAQAYARMEPTRVDLRTFGAALAVTMLLAFGIRLPAESFIRHFARRIAFNCGPSYGAGATAPAPARSRSATSPASDRAD